MKLGEVKRLSRNISLTHRMDILVGGDIYERYTLHGKCFGIIRSHMTRMDTEGVVTEVYEYQCDNILYVNPIFNQTGRVLCFFSILSYMSYLLK